MLGEKRRDWLEDVLEGDEFFVEQAALLHQIQAGGQTRQPDDGKGKHTELNTTTVCCFRCNTEADLSW